MAGGSSILTRSVRSTRLLAAKSHLSPRWQFHPHAEREEYTVRSRSLAASISIWGYPHAERAEREEYTVRSAANSSPNEPQAQWANGFDGSSRYRGTDAGAGNRR